jgi:hypothetical protein
MSNARERLKAKLAERAPQAPADPRQTDLAVALQAVDALYSATLATIPAPLKREWSSLKHQDMNAWATLYWQHKAEAGSEGLFWLAELGIVASKLKSLRFSFNTKSASERNLQLRPHRRMEDM